MLCAFCCLCLELQGCHFAQMIDSTEEIIESIFFTLSKFHRRSRGHYRRKQAAKCPSLEERRGPTRAVLLRFKRIASKPCEYSTLRSLAQLPPQCNRRALRLTGIRRHLQPGRRAWTHPPSRHQLRILILGSLRQLHPHGPRVQLCRARTRPPHNRPWLAYYDPAPRRWIRAFPVRHIIGRLCLICLMLWLVTLIYTFWWVPDRALLRLMKCYLDSKDTETIPSHLAKYSS